MEYNLLCIKNTCGFVMGGGKCLCTIPRCHNRGQFKVVVAAGAVGAVYIWLSIKRFAP